MRTLVVHPGASYATADVHNGYVRALRAQGHTVREYALDRRIDDASEYYRFIYRRRGQGLPPFDLVLTKAANDLIPQALYHNVDGVILISLMYFHPDFLVLLRRAGIRTAAVLTEEPYDSDKAARVVPWVDVAFSNERSSVPYLRQFNANTHYLGPAFDPQVSRVTVLGATPHHDVLFLGTLFEERMHLLAGVDWTGIDLGLYGSFKILPSRHKLRRYVRGEIIPNHLAQSYYRNAKIVLNPYRDSRGFGRGVEHIEHAESLNPRALELAACGAFSVSEKRAEVAEVFGDLVPTYAQGDSKALEATIRHYLSHEEERDAKAKALPAAVRGHTYAARAAELTAQIEAAWSPRKRMSA